MSFFDRYEDKFFLWARKIDDEVEFMEKRGDSDEEIREYLQKCADMREDLDPSDLTETEEYYTEKVQADFLWYGVSDPIYDRIFNIKR